MHYTFKKALFAGPFFIICYLSSSNASDLGSTGLIDIPTARMMEDGVFKASISKQDTISVYSLNYQVTPWLETTFRYAGFEDFFYYDRSYEVKFRLAEESHFFPQVALGIRDIAGTGVFGSEYLVGSKKIGNFDVSLGVGWGRLAGKNSFKNPLINLSDSFSQRDAVTGLGGELSFSDFFSGQNAGLFGGVSYSFDDYPLKFLLEYNPDEYNFEKDRSDFDIGSPVSVGLEWNISDNLYLTTSYQHKKEFGFRLSAKLNTKVSSNKFEIKPFKSSLFLDESNVPEGYNLSVWYDRLLYDMEKSGLYLYEAEYSEDDDTVTLEIGNKSFHHWPDAIASTLDLADLHLPKRYKSISIILLENGYRMHTIESLRPSRVSRNSDKVFSNQLDIVSPRKIITPRNSTNFKKLSLPIDVSLQNKLQVMDPDNPLRYQIYARLGSNIIINKNLSINYNYAVNIDNNFDTIKRSSNSALPRVRSEIKKYLQEGENGIENLYLSYRNSFKKNFHYRLEAGILEDMFSGVGGEFLYSPSYSRLAFGISGHNVKKRDYDRMFSHLDYETFTGFVSAYWASPLYNFDVAIHAGRYLANDRGFTLELNRTFDNGWKIGAWASKTNVSAELFGEGSFDKGLYFKVPLYTIFNRDGRNSYQTYLRSTQRDGGARLEGITGSIWHSLRDIRYDLLIKNKSRMRP